MKKLLLSLAAAVFGLTATAGTVTFDFSQMGYENAEDIEEVTIAPVTLTFSLGTNSNKNNPKYYNTGKAIRLYGGNTMTVSADGQEINEITLTFSSGEGSNTISVNPGTWNVSTWTGDATSVLFSIDGTTGHRRVATVSVTYGGEGSGNPGSGDTGGNEPGSGEPGDVELTDVLTNLSNGETVSATAVVMAQTTVGLVLADKAGAVYLYNSNYSNLAVGTIVNVSGTLTTFGTGLQFNNSATVKVVGSEPEVTYPTPTVYTAEMIEQAVANTENVQCTYVTFEGTLNFSGNYINVIVEGATNAQGSIQYPTSELKANLTDGSTYQLTGYFSGVSTSKYFNIVVTKATLISSGDPGTNEPTPDKPDAPQGTITVADALSLIEAGYEGDAVVEGVITEITEISSQYGNATYIIKDAGASDDAKGLTVYRGYYLGGEKFTSEDQLQIGDEVIVSGKLVDYNGTYEFTTGSKILSLNGEEYQNPDKPGNPDLPEGTMTVTEALKYVEEGNNMVSATVAGYIINVEEISIDNGYATYTIADNLTDSEGLLIFQGLFIDGEEFTKLNQIYKGGFAVVDGTLLSFNSVVEMVNSSIISYVEPEGGTPEVPENPGDEGGVVKAIFSESFTESIDSFTTAGELPTGLTYVWTHGGPNYGAKASAYVGGTRYEVTNWLVSPAIDLAGYTDIYFTFDNALNYLSGNPATDFVGVYVAPAGTAAQSSGWTDLSNQVTFGTGSSWDFVESGEINIPESLYDQKIQIAFSYSATTTVAPTWEVKNLVVTGTTVAGVEEIGFDLDAPVEFYNLQGLKVANPVKGQIYILRQGKTAKKVIF